MAAALLLIPILAACLLPAAGHSETPMGPPYAAQVEAYFSPGGGATEAVVREVGAAKREILVQAYTLTSLPVVLALLKARERGVTLGVVLDKSERGEGMTPAAMLSQPESPCTSTEATSSCTPT